MQGTFGTPLQYVLLDRFGAFFN